jgi:hypothetical protein
MAAITGDQPGTLEEDRRISAGRRTLTRRQADAGDHARKARQQKIASCHRPHSYWSVNHDTRLRDSAFDG